MSAIPFTRKISPEEAAAAAASDWEDPLPLTEHEVGDPYPLDALPGPVKATVQEVQGFIQAPTALVAASVLSALSAAAQGLANVERDKGLVGPCSLYFLSIAESGERKSAIDTTVLEGIRAYEIEEEESAKGLRKIHAAKYRSWEAQVDGVTASIRADAKTGKPVGALESKLMQLEREKPAPVIVPRALWDDTTTEALIAGMASNWPSAAIISAEAGVVFGGHSMKKDNLTGGLATLNKLWSGEPIRADRKTEGASVILNTGRLTLGLAVQQSVVRQFFESSKGIARGSGFAARFLISWPASTQGTRFYKSMGTTMATHRFTVRLKDMIGATELLVDGCNLKTVPLSPAGKAAWVSFHDGIEGELLPDREFSDNKDSASKAAENVARLACLFHLFEHGPSGQISAEHVGAAAAIVTWHLFEARRFLGEIAQPADQIAAERLDAWLLQQPGPVTAKAIMNKGPTDTRKRAALDKALQELVACHRVRVSKVGKSSIVSVNPALRQGG
ncbi:YfjI family protein [Acidithiobacillus ferruginosus]|uniref:YfjI family protein n=1 Tax=Acidithiobacillus ferruginosus TaxID=3063951 RepID=A0ACD5IJP6_9PROT|nr:YfjI family protein [Acidithiobacillus ferruginosus]MBU2815352.1 DUF3987 domain-containing protein [Acidithiobacillus ferruginosus]